MVALSANLNIPTTAAAGSEWNQTYSLQNDDGTPMNIVGKTFEFVIRNTATEANTVTPIARITSSASTTQGAIVVNTTASTVQVIISPTVTTPLWQSAWPYTLWMDPNLPDATVLVAGMFFTTAVAAV